MIVGIDPGFTGAIAFLDSSGLIVHDMPVFKTPRGKNVLNLNALGEILIPDKYGRNVAVIELQGPRPLDGKDRVFQSGRGYGALEMAVTGHGYEVHYVTPPVWKKYFKMCADKDVSRGLACQRFPQNASLFARVKDHGRAEAALIALYGAEKSLGRDTNPT